jgi:hypothetical protein
MIMAMRGDEELGRRAADLAGRLPDALAPLARIAYDYRGCWFAGGFFGAEFGVHQACLTSARWSAFQLSRG